MTTRQSGFTLRSFLDIRSFSGGIDGAEYLAS